jgi:hypothetical protein
VEESLETARRRRWRVAQCLVTGVERQTPRRMLLRLRTTIKQPDGRTTTQDDRFPAVQKSGAWRLDSSELYQSRAQRYVQHEAAYRRVTQEVLASAFKDRVSAEVALLRGLARLGCWRYRAMRRWLAVVLLPLLLGGCPPSPVGCRLSRSIRPR